MYKISCLIESFRLHLNGNDGSLYKQESFFLHEKLDRFFFVVFVYKTLQDSRRKSYLNVHGP